ncbi:MAG: ArsR family transcriptional regulator [Fibrobacterota bacterium]
MSEQFDEILENSACAGKLFSHPARIQILQLLAQNRCCVPADFFSNLPLSRGSINQHLTALKEANWIQTSLNGSQIQYCINDDVFDSSIHQMKRLFDSFLSRKKAECITHRKQKKKILFLCTGNSCRSQMAEGFFNTYASTIGWEAVSAGTLPAGTIHPLAISVMNEKGITLTGQSPKGITKFLGKERIALVIFVCSEAEENCPYLFPFASRKIKMPFEDPAAFVGNEEETRATFRAIRDQIETRIKLLLEELSTGEEHD